jgi:sterol desaturase/sphingolipid hydroxylase (fatty acid hydroxylase superfamily)
MSSPATSDRVACRYLGASAPAATTSWALMLAACVFNTAVLRSYTDAFTAQAGTGLFTIVLLAAMERLAPYDAQWRKSDGEEMTDAAHTGISAAVDHATRGCLATFVARSALVQAAAGTWGSQALASLPLLARIAAALVVGEIGGYASHWLFHVRSLPFWELHRVHHAVSRLWWLNTARFHPLDVVAQLVLVYPPLFAVGLGDSETLFWYGTIFNTVGQLSHCNVRSRAGPFNFVFNTPDCHRFHHNRRLSHSNSNYGQVLMIYDVLLGTFVNPGTSEMADGHGMGLRGLSSAGVLHNLWHPIAMMWPSEGRSAAA